MKKVGIATVHTGFNYGSCLQAYAGQQYISSLGYDTELLWYKDGIVKGRDVRIKKLLGMGLRTFWKPKLFKKTFLTYKKSLKKEIDPEIKEYFLDFQEKNLKVKKTNWRGLKSYANETNTLACVCGSDQIWNATNVYIDPIFYLRFAPKSKRVAYAPSFGKNEIPDYNKNIIKKYISDFKYISVREEQGTEIVKELLDRDVPAVIDPTLLLNKSEWMNCVNENMQLPKEYILVYFLDKPTQTSLAYIKKLEKELNMPIISIPYKYDELSQFKNLTYVNAGPEQFLNLISNARFVCTDSFHGMAFSANFNTPFYIFQRDYGTATDQSSRIISLLYKLNLKERFVYEVNEIAIKNFDSNIDFELTNKLLESERNKSKNYLLNAFDDINNSQK